MNTQHVTSSIDFSFEEHAIRTIIRNGEPWFFASDVCGAISLDNTAIRKLDDDEKDLHSVQTLGGMQEVSIISESGLYTIILRCRDAIKPGTVPYRFRKWVTGEVLPQIRKTGSYTSHQTITAPALSTYPPFSDDHANRTEIIYYQDFKPVFCRVLGSDEVVMSHESMMEWLEKRGLIFFTRDELKNLSYGQFLAITSR